MQNQNDVSIWMPIYIGDMLAMTTRLTTEQIGGLYLLIMDYWKNGAIPNDVKIIGAITNLSVTKTKALVKNIINIGIFSIENDELISRYLDDKKMQANDNKNAKSERAKKGAEARWGKISNEKHASDLAQNKHTLSNAQAMTKQSVSNAKSMLEQCPLSSSSSINNSLSNAHEPKTADEVLQKAEQIRFEKSQDILNWQIPTFKEMQDMLTGTNYLGTLTEQDYLRLASDMKTHYEAEALVGKVLATDSLRKNKLRDWIIRNAQYQSKPSYNKPKNQLAQYGGANDPLAVNAKWRSGETGIVEPNTVFDFTQPATQSTNQPVMQESW